MSYVFLIVQNVVVILNSAECRMYILTVQNVICILNSAECPCILNSAECHMYITLVTRNSYTLKHFCYHIRDRAQWEFHLIFYKL